MSTHDKAHLIAILRRAHEQFLAEVRDLPRWHDQAKRLEKVCARYAALTPRRFRKDEPVAAGALLHVEIEGLQKSRGLFFVGFENWLEGDRRLWRDYGFPDDVQFVEARRVQGLRVGDSWTEPAPSRADFDQYRYTIRAIE